MLANTIIVETLALVKYKCRNPLTIDECIYKKNIFLCFILILSEK